LCIQVANSEHILQPGSGTCVPLPDVNLAIPQEDSACLEGPGTVFPAVTTLPAGEPLKIEGMSEDEAWWNVLDPQDRTRSCWVLQSQSTFQGDISEIPLSAAPTPPAVAAQSVTITGITLNPQGFYAVAFTTQGFTPQIPGTHIHFFFDIHLEDQFGPGCRWFAQDARRDFSLCRFFRRGAPRGSNPAVCPGRQPFAPGDARLRQLFFASIPLTVEKPWKKATENSS
jgi:hypothetical protein